jgi:hypothetical protein
MVYLHPWEIDPDQPRISASWLSRFRQYNNLDSTETKCQKLLDDFSWAPMEDVLADISCPKRGFSPTPVESKKKR